MSGLEQARRWAWAPVRLAGTMHRSGMKALEHDCLNVAQATAYSAIVTLFPGLIIAAALVSVLPFSMPLRIQLAIFFDRILPPTVSPMLDTYFQTMHRTPQTTRAMVGSMLVSVFGATSVMATLMEGFRRAYELPDGMGVWLLRKRALLLVPLSMVPFAVASAIVVFGNLFTLWLTRHVDAVISGPVLLMSVVLRWSVAVSGCIGILAVVYHMGTPMERSNVKEPGTQPWREVIPGASVATAMWFVATITFGWYVTRFANYSQVYGSLGAGIALMIWLYIVALCVLFGAEFNAQLFLRKNAGGGGETVEIPSKMAEADRKTAG